MQLAFGNLANMFGTYRNQRWTSAGAVLVISIFGLISCGSGSAEQVVAEGVGDGIAQFRASSRATIDIAAIQDTGRFAVFDGAVEGDGGTLAPAVVVEQKDGELTRWEVGDGVPLINPLAWSDGEDLYVKAARCPGIQLKGIDNSDYLSDSCKPLGKVIVLRVSLTDGSSEVVVEDVPAQGDGVGTYVPGSKFDIVARPVGFEAQELFSVDRTTGIVSALGQFSGPIASICPSGSGFLRVAGSLPTDIAGPGPTIQLGPEPERDPQSGEVIRVPESPAEGPLQSVEYIDEISSKKIVAPELPNAEASLGPTGCGPDESVVFNSLPPAPALMLTRTPDGVLSWTEIPKLPESKSLPSAVQSTANGTLIAYGTQKGRRDLELFILQDGAWTSAGITGSLDPPDELAVSGEHIAVVAQGFDRPEIEVRSI